MSDRLQAAAAAHQGILCTADATRLAVDSNALARLVGSGTLVRVRRGAYVVADTWAHATPERRLDLCTRAVLRARATTSDRAEKQREDLLRSLGYEVVRLTWADLARPKRVEALIRSAMRRVEARSHHRTA